jgi:ribosomal protein S18 acetylase RimI-like enzyme
MNTRFYRFTIIFLTLSFILGLSYYWLMRSTTGPIVPYDPQKDRAALIEIFKQNMFWLTTNPDEKDALKSFEQNLDTRSSSNLAFDRGNLTIMVYRDAQDTKGFIAYHRHGWSSARILYLGIHEKYRRRGYAETLMRYAIEDIKEQGYSRIEIFTRVINERAQNLYKKFGFTSYWTDGEYITYERLL